MVNTSLSPVQTFIVREICKLEICSLNELMHADPDEDLMSFYKGLNNPEYASYYDWLGKGLDKFTKVLKDPDLLFQEVNGDYMRAFRHILAHESEFGAFRDKPNAVSNLWRKIFTIEEFNPSLLTSVN